MTVSLKLGVGQVIRFAYLWWNEARSGRDESSKDRPCVVVHLRENEHGETEAFACPITRTPPMHPEKAMEIAVKTKARLGLDPERSWIITTEVNRFIWPGPDIRAVPGGGWTYGLLPANMIASLIAQVRSNAADRSLLMVKREDDAQNYRG